MFPVRSRSAEAAEAAADAKQLQGEGIATRWCLAVLKHFETIDPIAPWVDYGKLLLEFYGYTYNGLNVFFAVFIYIYVHTYIHTYIYIYVYVCICMYIYTY